MASTAVQATPQGGSTDAPPARLTPARQSDDPSGPHAHKSRKSGDYSCPHCGLGLASKTARWDHVSTCARNPNPACRWCAAHYSPRELARHEARCPMRAEPADRADGHAPPIVTEESDAQDAASLSDGDLGDENADAKENDRSSSEADDAEPAMDARDALSEAVFGEPPASATTPTDADTLLLSDQVAIIRLWPGVSPPPKDAEFLADLYRATLYLHAKGLIQPAMGQEGEAMWDRYVDTLEKRLTSDEMDELSEVSHEWHPQVRALLGAAFRPPPKPRLSVSQGFLIGCIGFALGALVTYNAHKEREKRAAAEAAAAAQRVSPSLPAVRPAWNPDVHGSVEEYRAAFAHLSGPLDAPGTVGLDRSAQAPPASALFTTTADEERARQQRERRRVGQ